MHNLYWSRNSKVLDNPEVNKTFQQVLLMSDFQLEKWIDDTRAYILKVWDEDGTPPLNGLSETEMADEFQALYEYNAAVNLQRTDSIDGQSNVILNPISLGGCVNQFFPTMLKAKINYNTSLKNGNKFNGYAVYDLFANDRFRNRMQLGFKRHFRRDSFYKYSISIERGTDMGIVPCNSGYDWVNAFHNYPHLFEGYNFWLNEVDPEKAKGSGYTEVDANKFLWITKDEIERILIGRIQPSNMMNLPRELDDKKQYHIRFFKESTRIFPDGFTAFKIGYIQVAVNFPPVIAKFMYDKYTRNLKNQDQIIVYDPSAGWGGRIAGAMSINDGRKIHYVGTDPNTDNMLIRDDLDLGISRYEYLASKILDATQIGFNAFLGKSHSFDLYQEGSEEIGTHPRFQQYKGKVDFIFTSPPYFSKELYSEDESQSANKFPKYEGWKKGYLRPTLETCVEWLKRNRYLAWNISDVKMGKEGSYIPLEDDSNQILRELGMEFVGIEKMALMNMPGSNRIGEDGKPTAKNFCKVNGRWRKYEPIFIWRKP